MRVTVNGVRIFFEVIGSKFAIDGDRMREKPTLVLLHGGPGINDHSAYRPRFDTLSDIAQVLLIDQRGNGRSDVGVREKLTLAQWGDDIRALCDVLEVEKPVVMGNSFGGMVALSYATRHPEHPGKLIISSTISRGTNYYRGASIAMFAQLGGAEAGELAQQFLGGKVTPELGDLWLKKVLPLYTQSPGQLTDPQAQARTVMRRDVGRDFVEGEMRTFDLLEELRAIRCPTLLLAGELDPICPVQASDDMAAVIDPALLTYRRYPRCGHGAYRDVPEAFDEIRRFIALVG